MKWNPKIKKKMTKETKVTLKEVNLSNARGFKEEYSDYRKRLKENYNKTKFYLMGDLLWDSSTKGTYKK